MRGIVTAGGLVTALLLAVLRGADLVAQADAAFAVLLGCLIRDKIVSAIDEPFQTARSECRAGASVGIARFPTGGNRGRGAAGTRGRSDVP